MNEVIQLKYMKTFAPFYLLVIVAVLVTVLWSDRTVTVLSESAPLTDRHCIIIDAGHGGVDGGATSCTGVLESQINLEISLRLNDLCHLLGMETKMIRTTDISVYTEGRTISQKKVSDLKHRVQIINETPNATVISIHQNYFSDGKYSGAQVFYPKDETSRRLAEAMQLAFGVTGSTRIAKPSQGVYLMEHIRCPGVLVECGFLSNPQEEAKLRSPEYQKLLCCVIVSTLSTAGNA
jgi:N-acetylmuramoyl-L-alanine amidase